MKDVYILGIETSCDETSVSIIKNGHEEIATTVLSQMDVHANFGGVVPEIASRMHTENITMVLAETMQKSGMAFEDIDAIAVTYAPGLIGSLIVGVEFAKALSYAIGKPLIKVHHIAGHIYSNNLVKKIEYPCLALVVSGGHTDLVILEDDYKFKVLGHTLDDAIGETFDKVARVLNISYPGGPNLELMAKDGKPNITLPIAMNDNTYNFSYSGLKSAVVNFVNNEKQKGNYFDKEDLACSFQHAAVAQLSNKVDLALKRNQNIKNMLIAGGVSANEYLRNEIKKVADKYHVDLCVPPLKYCTDNAAMIGCAAYFLYIKGDFADLSLSPKSQEYLFEER